MSIRRALFAARIRVAHPANAIGTLFAWDSYRRLVQMFANVVRGMSGGRLRAVITELKAERGVKLDTELSVWRSLGCLRNALSA